MSLYISNDHGRTYKFDFSIFDRKYPFSVNFVQKIKVVSLTLISVPRQIQTCRILWYSVFSALDWKHPFWSNLVQKIKSVSLSWNLVPRIIPMCKIQWCCSIFLLYTKNTLFVEGRQKESNYFSCYLTGVETFELGSCCQHGSFILLRWVRPWIVFVHCLKRF